MKVSEFLQEVREFTTYAAYCASQGGVAGWLMINGVHGPAPVFSVSGEAWRKTGLIFCPLQTIYLGWDAVLEFKEWRVKPLPAEIIVGLDMPTENYNKISAAASGAAGHHKRLRADLLSACSMGVSS